MKGRRGWLRRCFAVGLALLWVVASGCGGGEEAGEAEEEALEPRIVTEGPVDAPGRPEGRGEGAAVTLAAEDAARWVPHLTVSDLAASVEFYRRLGFVAVDGAEGASRVELEREGVRLALVAAVADEAGGAEGEAAAGEAAAGEERDDATPAAAPVLHLVDEAGGAPREVRDPDGHRLVIPGG